MADAGFLSDVQFEYHAPEMGRNYHTLKAYKPVEGLKHPAHVGSMLWNSREILNVGTTPGFERRGVATSLWHEGQRLATEHQRIPQPKHSRQRTTVGDAWARAVGGRLPRKQVE